MRVKDIDNRWVYRFLYKWQWSFLTSNTKGQFLPDESTEMNEMRRAHRSQRVIEGVPWQMVLNFDQLWRSSVEAPSKVLHKRSAKQATREGDQFMEVRPDDLIGKRLQAVLKLAENEMTSRMGQAPKASKLRKAAARSEFVVGGRVGVTAVTATWGDGTIGPLGVCLTTGALPRSVIQDYNSSYKGRVFIFESGTETHFMNAESTLLYMQELLGPVSWRVLSIKASLCSLCVFSGGRIKL